MKGGPLKVIPFHMDCYSVMMNKDRNQMTETILDLTLEIIYLLTGEDYVIIKKPGSYSTHSSNARVSEGSYKTQGLSMVVSPYSLIQDGNKGKKILELIDKIIHLLTIEEWNDLEHNNPKKDVVMETHQLFISLDGSVSRDVPGANHKPIPTVNFGKKSERENKANHIKTYLNINKPIKTQINAKTCKEKSVMCAEGTLTNYYTPTEHTQTGYRSFYVKEEPASRENVTNPEISRSTELPQVEYTFTCIEKGLVACEQGNPVNIDHYLPTEQIQTEYSSSQIKEEPALHGVSNLTDIDFYLSTDHLQTECASSESKEVLVSQKGGILKDIDMYPPTYQTNSHLTSYNIKHNLASCKEKVHKQKKLNCFDCGKTFPYKSMLVIHQRVHTEEKPYTCPVCGKCFSRKSHLVTHQKIHTGEKPYSCPECGKGFNQEANLIAHQRIHTGEKPFCCSDCGRCFSRKIYLNTHQRTHTGEKPFSCSECGKCFSQKSALNTHARTHTGQKKCSCPECGKCFSQKSYLNVHQRIHIGQKSFSFSN
ncbi:gastrula zinc finger -like [Pelobates cultripes]|uniref:Gastrula zinc finger -like n=1 Tax=Pelobates cultripes TaxID=61616 RepID=A0AAD1TAC9_PELCU|nr:gastrula zinc finger -like [Pelobates cultripes]